MSMTNSTARLNAAREREFLRVKTELDLTAMQNERAKPIEGNGPQSVVINGAVTQLITGAGNTGTVNIDSASARDLSEALTGVISALSSSTPDGSEKALMDVAEEVKQEVQKPEPNRFKISGLLTGLDKGLAIIPKARTAYEILRRLQTH